MGRKRSQKACLNCRRRHLKCDEETPACRRCTKAKLDCIPGNGHQFRFINFDLGDHSSDSRIGSPSTTSLPCTGTHSEKATFVDETALTIDAHSKHSEDWKDGAGLHSSSVDGSNQHVPASPWDMSTSNVEVSEFSSLQSIPMSENWAFNNPPTMIGYPLATDFRLSESVDMDELLYDFGFEQTPPGLSKDAGTLITDSESVPLPSAWEIPFEEDGSSALEQAENPMLPERNISNSFHTISHPREAYLIKFFTQTWGPIFDCLDADLTFTRTVVQVALTASQPLLWAILATSALQLSQSSDYPFAAAQYYRSRCSKSIMPALLDSTTIKENEETLLATYVMVRNYEHMTKNLLEADSNALFTATLAISANPADPLSEKADIGRAAFWVHLRQDIHMALLLHVPIRTDYPPCLQRKQFLSSLDSLMTTKTPTRQILIDCAWANRMASIIFDVINYAFQREPREIETWISLRGNLDQWSMTKPLSFRPYYEMERSSTEGRTFPEIWITSDCHVLAWLYFHTATILLKVYLPSSGSREAAFPASRGLADNEEIQLHARAIAGIVATNPNAQALIIFCHIATVSAIFFTEKAEQTETIRLIRMANKVTGHPYKGIEKKLYEQWGCGSYV